MKRALIAAVLLLAACSHADVPDSVNEDCNLACEQVIMYDGKPLHCIAWTGAYGEVGYTCDFVRFHEEVPPV